LQAALGGIERAGIEHMRRGGPGDHLELAVMADYGQVTAAILTGKVPLADLT